MRYSKQKEEVLKIVRESYNHPDAKNIYKIVKKRIPNISLGTVYRNLNNLSNEGIIKKISLENGNDRYDKTLTNHNHITCIKCGKICDVSVLLKTSEIVKIQDETGFKITDSNFNINGICKDCMEGRKN